MQCVIYISNKPQYLKNEEFFLRTYHFKSSVKYDKLNFHIIYTLNLNT